MEIKIASYAGACYGVERALEMVNNAASQHDTIYTLGPLIHNPLVVKDLEQKGIQVSDSCDLPEDTTLVIRTHGVVPETTDEANQRGLNVIDATCPFVKKVHAAASKLQSEGYQVLIVGEKGHPEVEGIQGYAKDALVVGSVDELSTIELKRRVGVVVQTTQSEACLQEIVSYLVSRVQELRVINTICSATEERQSAAYELSREADCMIVIGGKISANTTRLYEICKSNCPNTHHIETATEIDPKWFEGVDVLGITAGASTPQTHINHVVAAITKLIDA